MSLATPHRHGWLCLAATLPTDDPAARMRVLRTLESLGAALLREGVYLLPNSAGALQGLQSLADYVVRNGGSATVMHADAVSEAQQRSFEGLFDRTARYEELIKVIESLKVGYGVADPGALLGVVQKQRREFEAIGALDFFPSAARERAQGALVAAEAQVKHLMFPQAEARPGKEAAESFAQRTWATRLPLWADRLACAWLVRRFIDPEARVLWLDKVQPCPADAVGFAFDGARFANTGTRVTFEAMLRRFELAGNEALTRIGAIVHALEARDAPVAEAAGVQTLLQGAQRRSGSPGELLAEAEKTFDLLYEAYLESRR